MVIYEPTGAAKEYCDLAINLYRGCSHGCKYCYAPQALRMTRGNFSKAVLRNLPIEKMIEREAIKYAGREVQLCFTCDPYQPLDVETKLTRRAIEILNANGVYVRILTKAGMNSTRDFDLLSKNPHNWYGATLTFIGDADKIKYEPGAAWFSSRYSALKLAKAMGIKTWVSLEPVINVSQTIEIITLTHDVVDKYYVGKLNHSKAAVLIDWEDFALSAMRVLERYGKEYYIKEGLRKYLE